MRYNGAGLGPTWPGVNKVASEEGVVLDDKVMLSKGSTNVKKDAFFDYLVLGGSGRVRDKETISKEKKVKTKRTSEHSELGKRNKKNKTVLSQEAHSIAVDEHIEKEQALMTRWLNSPAAVPARDKPLGWSILTTKLNGWPKKTLKGWLNRSAASALITWVKIGT